MLKECSRCESQFETSSEFVKVCPSCLRAYRIARGLQKPEGWQRKTADKQAYFREWRKANQDKLKEYEARKPKRTPEQERAKYERRMKRLHGEDWVPLDQRPENPLKEVKKRARTIYKTALRRGKLVRTPCHICGATEVEGHHPDYSRPLDVVWLCKKHHQEIHS